MGRDEQLTVNRSWPTHAQQLLLADFHILIPTLVHALLSFQVVPLSLLVLHVMPELGPQPSRHAMLVTISAWRLVLQTILMDYKMECNKLASACVFAVSGLSCQSVLAVCPYFERTF